MSAKTFFSLSALGAALVLNGTAVMAQANSTTMARTYTVTPKQGMTAQFEAALREHAQWRADNGDPWSWTSFMHETGDNIGSYYIRSGNHSWADLDAYDVGFGPQGLLHWNATVAPLVENITSSIRMADQSISNGPPAGWAWSLVTITRIHLRPGRESEFNRLVSQANEVLKGKLPGYWVWVSSPTGGGPGPWMDVVTFAANWADMAQPDPSMDAVMMQEMGEDAYMEWATEFGQTYRGVEVYTMRRRPDLDVN